MIFTRDVGITSNLSLLESCPVVPEKEILRIIDNWSRALMIDILSMPSSLLCAWKSLSGVDYIREYYSQKFQHFFFRCWVFPQGWHGVFSRPCIAARQEDLAYGICAQLLVICTSYWLDGRLQGWTWNWWTRELMGLRILGVWISGVSSTVLSFRLPLLVSQRYRAHTFL